MTYVLGEGLTHEQAMNRRKIAEQMRALASRQPQNVGQGIQAIASALVARGADRQANAADERLRGEFEEGFAKAAPNVQGLIDLAESPYASGSHKRVIRALMDGAPNYRRGTRNHRGGQAVVGEDGPEVVTLPPGAQVDPMSGMQREINDLTPEQLQRFNERLGQGLSDTEALYPDGYDPRSMLMGDQSRFQDDKAYQTAELDAFKLMQLRPEYDASTIPDNKLTEGQAKTLGYLRRAMFANAALEDPRLAQAMTRHDNAFAGGLGALGRLYTNDEYELGKLMAEQFSSAILRRDSGAQTPDPEVARYMRQYFPLSGETDAQLAAKRALRDQEIRGLMMSLGEDVNMGQLIQREIDELRAQADVPDGSLTGNAPPLSAEDEEFLKSLGLK